MTRNVFSCFASMWLGALAVCDAAQPNVLIITTDDMSCDSVGVYGCKLADTTPNMDKLAAQCVRFNYAHTVVGNCMPSRNVMWSGRYPHNNHIDGFRPIPKEAKDYPVLGDIMKAAGWFTGIRHKVSHSTPYSPFPWDIDLDTDDQGQKPHTKDAPSYGASMTQGINAAKAAGKPFCLMLNIADPHKPFFAEGRGGAVVDDPHTPTRVFKPEEVPVPGFLPDDPVIRQELSLYYSSVRRADDAVGAILQALKASGEDENTVIVFLSDHGMPLPFSKTQLYLHSTRTPLMIRWPDVTKAGTVDDSHMVSTVDLLPTLLDMVGVQHPEGFDGRSLAPLLKGQDDPDRTMVFKEYNENSGGQRTPMRAVQTKDYLYVFNPWSNGT
ncbi:MAG: sulfatase, partial [Verrucomicrobiales bacterium]|nr:sulfatase [Verrucomicrobiales bacterium]